MGDIGILYALQVCGERAFYRWLTRDYRSLFPWSPERLRLFRAVTAHWAWTEYCWAEPSLLGMADTYGTELIHPRRKGCRSRSLGDKGLSNWRWIIGAKIGYIICQEILLHVWANAHPAMPFQLVAVCGWVAYNRR